MQLLKQIKFRLPDDLLVRVVAEHASKQDVAWSITGGGIQPVKDPNFSRTRAQAAYLWWKKKLGPPDAWHDVSFEEADDCVWVTAWVLRAEVAEFESINEEQI